MKQSIKIIEKPIMIRDPKFDSDQNAEYNPRVIL